MANNAFNNLMGNNQPVQQQPYIPPVNPNGNILTEWNNFKNSFQGDPEAIGKQMVNNGMIPPQLFNALSTLANTYRGKLN